MRYKLDVLMMPLIPMNSFISLKFIEMGEIKWQGSLSNLSLSVVNSTKFAKSIRNVKAKLITSSVVAYDPMLLNLYNKW